MPPPSAPRRRCAFKLPRNDKYQCQKAGDKYQPGTKLWYCSLHDRHAKDRCQVLVEWAGKGAQCQALGRLDEQSGKKLCEWHTTTIRRDSWPQMQDAPPRRRKDSARDVEQLTQDVAGGFEIEHWASTTVSCLSSTTGSSRGTVAFRVATSAPSDLASKRAADPNRQRHDSPTEAHILPVSERNYYTDSPSSESHTQICAHKPEPDPNIVPKSNRPSRQQPTPLASNTEEAQILRLKNLALNTTRNTISPQSTPSPDTVSTNQTAHDPKTPTPTPTPTTAQTTPSLHSPHTPQTPPTPSPYHTPSPSPLNTSNTSNTPLYTQCCICLSTHSDYTMRVIRGCGHRYREFCLGRARKEGTLRGFRCVGCREGVAG